MNMVSVEIKSTRGMGRGVVSTEKILNWFFAITVCSHSTSAPLVHVLVEVACNCMKPHRKMDSIIEIPEVNSVVVHCKYCNQPLARFSGIVTEDWKIEVNEALF